MIVCHCEGWTDRDLRRMVRGPRSVDGPVPPPVACPAGRACGGCLPLVLRILAEEERKVREERARAALGRAG